MREGRWWATDRDPHEGGPVARGLRVGRVFGVPVVLAPSSAITALAGAGVFARFFVPGDVVPSVVQAGVGLLAAAAIALLAVLAHEVGHAAVGRACGLQVLHIQMAGLGDHTAVRGACALPGRLALTAAAGPVTNLVLAAVGVALLPSSGSLLGEALGEFFVAAHLLLALNLLPALPLDGGVVVRGVVTRLSGSDDVGRRTVGITGCLTGLGLAGWALWPLLTGTVPADPLRQVGVLLVATVLAGLWLTVTGLVAALAPR